MKRLAILCLSFAVLAVGCESDSGGDGGGGGGSDATVGDDTNGGGGGGGAACQQPDLGEPDIHAWDEFTWDGTTYTLNSCPNGIDLLQGAWAFYCPPDNCVLAPQLEGYEELFTFDGNTWTSHMRQGAEEGTMSGFYWCAQKPENEKEVKVFVVESVEPAGAFDWQPGTIWSTDILGLEEGMNDFYQYIYLDRIATQATDDDYADSFYCKVGEEISDGSCCENPFAE